MIELTASCQLCRHFTHWAKSSALLDISVFFFFYFKERKKTVIRTIKFWKQDNEGLTMTNTVHIVILKVATGVLFWWHYFTHLINPILYWFTPHFSFSGVYTTYFSWSTESPYFIRDLNAVCFAPSSSSIFIFSLCFLLFILDLLLLNLTQHIYLLALYLLSGFPAMSTRYISQAPSLKCYLFLLLFFELLWKTHELWNYKCTFSFSTPFRV